MSFSPKCAEFQPTIFLIEGFVTVVPTGIQTRRIAPQGKQYTAGEALRAERSLRDYPQPVLTAFNQALQNSLSKIAFKTAKTPPSAPLKPLFKVQSLAGIEDAPTVLASGDVLVCFAVFPQSYKFTAHEPTFQIRSPLGGDLDNVIKALQKRIADQFMNQWKLLADPKRSVLEISAAPDPPDPDTLGLGHGKAEPLEIVLTAGSRRKTFFASRTCAIDAGSVVGVAVDNVYPSPSAAPTRDAAKKQIIQILASGAGETEAFAPKAVEKLAQSKLVGVNDLLAAIGRGLGYTTVHEIWHATRGPKTRGHVPEDSGLPMLSTIEGAGNPSFQKDGLVLLDKSVAEILAEYEQTWCRFIQDDRVIIETFRR